MKKIAFSLLCMVCLSANSNAQLMVSKLISKREANFGLGYGLFMFYDIPLSTENKSIRLELIDFAFYPTKGEPFFTSTADARGYISIKLGYKYVFSDTKTGFYLLPSAGYCRTVFITEGQDKADYGDGIAGALEGGYELEVGQRENTFNFSLKYEYDHGKSDFILQSIGFRVSYSFGLFKRKEF